MPLLPANSELPQLRHDPVDFGQRFLVPLIILFLGAIADAITTWRNLRQFGTEVEAHLAQRFVCDVVGINFGVPMAKLIQLGFVLLVAAWWKPWTSWLLVISGALYGAAAISNHYLLL